MAGRRARLQAPEGARNSSYGLRVGDACPGVCPVARFMASHILSW